MRLRVLSDLHLEVASFSPPEALAEVVVLAGDIDEGTQGLEWAASTFPGCAIVHVPGNHEYYDGEFFEVRRRMRERAVALGIVHLDDKAAIVQGVRFVGATLWADLLLYGEAGREALLARGLERLVEYRCVRFDGEPFTPDCSMALHRASRAFLERALREPFDGPTVVITHHAPHPRSVHPRFAGSVVNPAFVSDLSALMGRSALWIHGHSHASHDYRERGTRVVANPRGYAGENADFDPALVVEV